MQRMMGNQAMLQLLASGALQAKLRVSQPGDPDEQDADRVAEQIVPRHGPPILQRKCACGGTCSHCQEEEEQNVHRSARGSFQAFPLSIQRQAATAATSEEASHRAAEAGAREDQARHPGERPRILVVDDDAQSVGAEQMRKTQFLTLLSSRACAAADAVLQSVGHTSKSCPYLKKWLDYYHETDTQHLIDVMHKYAPET